MFWFLFHPFELYSLRTTAPALIMKSDKDLKAPFPINKNCKFPKAFYFLTVKDHLKEENVTVCHYNSHEKATLTVIQITELQKAHSETHCFKTWKLWDTKKKVCRASFIYNDHKIWLNSNSVVNGQGLLITIHFSNCVSRFTPNTENAVRTKIAVRKC